MPAISADVPIARPQQKPLGYPDTSVGASPRTHFKPTGEQGRITVPQPRGAPPLSLPMPASHAQTTYTSVFADARGALSARGPNESSGVGRLDVARRAVSKSPIRGGPAVRFSS